MYKYSTFSQSNSIRVIELLSSWKRREPLAICLKEMPLDDTSRLEALSYSWDGQNSIVCDGQELLITATCEEALDACATGNKLAYCGSIKYASTKSPWRRRVNRLP